MKEGGQSHMASECCSKIGTAVYLQKHENAFLPNRFVNRASKSCSHSSPGGNGRAPNPRNLAGHCSTIVCGGTPQRLIKVTSFSS